MSQAVPDPGNSDRRPEPSKHSEPQGAEVHQDLSLNVSGPSLSERIASEFELMQSFAELAGLDPVKNSFKTEDRSEPPSLPYLEALEHYFPRHADTRPDALVLPRVRLAAFEPGGYAAWVLISSFDARSPDLPFVMPMPDTLDKHQPGLRKIHPIISPNVEFFGTAIGIAAKVDADAQIHQLLVIASPQAVREALQSAGANSEFVTSKRGEQPLGFVTQLAHPSIISSVLVLSALQQLKKSVEQGIAEVADHLEHAQAVLGITRHSGPTQNNEFELGLAYAVDSHVMSSGILSPPKLREQICSFRLIHNNHGVPALHIQETDYLPIAV